MAQRGSKKRLSVDQEDHISRLFNGKRSKSSGASATDKGDVRADHLLIECKMTTGRKPTLVTQFEKISQEAYEEGLTPMMALRFYDPASHIADKNGWIDLSVMLVGDIVEFYDNKT